MVITQEMIEQSCDYMPLMEKKRLVEEIAPKCIARVEMGYVPTGSEKQKPLPQRYQEMHHMTQMFTIGVLAKWYLLDDGIPEDYQMQADQYDQWASSHVMNQLERMKANKQIANKVFDLLYDFKEFRFMLQREIETQVEHHNDIVWRLIDAVNVELKESSADMMRTLANGTEPQSGMTEEQNEMIAGMTSNLSKQIEQLKEMRERLVEKRDELQERLNNAQKGDAE